MTCACGSYANASVVGKNGGRVPVCDSCITLEPDAVYRIPNHPHLNARIVDNEHGVTENESARRAARRTITEVTPVPKPFPASLVLPEWAKQGR